MSESINSNSSNWKIAVDTGGTFTDCVACSPSGEWKTCKVLSNGTLRGVLTEKKSDSAWKIDQNWKTVDDFPNGFEVRILGEEKPFGKVVSFDSGRSEIGITQISSASVPDAGSEIEIFSGLEAPVLAARLVTETPA